MSSDAAIRSLVAQDLTASFLVNAQGDVHSANAAAQSICDAAVGSHLSFILGRMFAAPDVLLFRLQGRCINDGATKEDVSTRNGQFRLSVVQQHDNSFLLRFEDAGRGTHSLGRAADALLLPMFTLVSQDAILYVNNAFRAL